MAITEKRKFGDLGEELAARYLEREGYEIVARNYRRRGGEIDIIALDKGQFVFAEVKTRSTAVCGSPVEAVTPRKLAKMTLTAKSYLLEQGADADDFRLDAIGVELDREGRRAKIRHFKSITNN
jgi:putative endonuclease